MQASKSIEMKMLNTEVKNLCYISKRGTKEKNKNKKRKKKNKRKTIKEKIKEKTIKEKIKEENKK